MAANLQQNDKQVGLKQAWHGKTQIVKEISFSNSSQNFEVVSKGIRDEDGNEIPGFKALVCSDNKQILSVAADTYKVIQNSEVWELLQNSLSGIPYVIESTGSVGNRSKFFASIKLGELTDYKVGARKFHSNINAIWSHDGTIGLNIHDSSVCIVCQNTVNASLASNHTFSFVVKHTKNAGERLAGVEKALVQLQNDRLEFKGKLQQLAETPCTLTTAEKLFLGFLTEGKDKVSTRTKNTVSRMKELFLGDKEPNKRGGLGNHGETMLDTFSAVTDFYTHESSGGDNLWKQFSSSEFGSASAKKAEFFQALIVPERQAKLLYTGEQLLASLLDVPHVASAIPTVADSSEFQILLNK